MTKPRTAAIPAASRNVSMSPEEAAMDALERLAAASGRVMALQMRVVITALTEGSTRYAETLNALARNSASLRGRQLPRSSVRYFLEPLRAWMDAATGLQAVMLEAQAQAQASALLAFPALPRPAASRGGLGNRRLTSVVIPFPDRRTKAAA